MPVPDLSGVRAKIGRAEYHLDCVRSDTAAFLSREPCPWSYRIETKPAPSKGVRYRMKAVVHEPCPPIWALIAGDAIHNLRSALDHMMWELTEPAHRHDRLYFPVFSDSAKFHIHAQPSLEGIPPQHRAFIQRAQPYHWGQKAGIHPLAILRELSNLDKHKVLVPVSIATDFEHVGAENAEIEFEYVVDRPLGHNAEIMRFVARPKDPSHEMKVDPRCTFQVGLENGLTGIPIHRFLGNIAHHVRWIIDGYFEFGILPWVDT